MARLNQILVVGAVTLLALTGCEGVQEASTPKTSTSQIPAATAISTSDKAGSPASYAELSGIVSNTKTAVQTGNFAKAKTEFDKFETAWKKVEDGIKKKSPKSYDAVEETAEKVMAELKKTNPSKDKVLAQLQSLEQTISSIPKS
jgi:hypothetical protein